MVVIGLSHWSFRIARIAKIDVKVHFTFALILALGAWQWGRVHGLRGAAFGVLLMTLLFVCVTLHELGHSLVARSFQLPADEIVLYPFGGAAQVDGDAPKPIQEALVAIAGPAVNVMIAAILLLITSAKLEWMRLTTGEHLTRAALARPSTTTLLVWLLSANLMMALFNMIPAFPMDGGRVLRSVLAHRVGAVAATRVAAGLGQALSLGIGIWALTADNYGLTATALVMFLGATGEQRAPARRSALASLRVGEVFNRNAITLVPGDPVARVIDHLLTSYQPDFAVIEGGELVGVVTRKRVLDALAKSTRAQEVAEIMDRQVPRIDARTSLEEVQERMQRESIPVVAVFEDEQGGRYLGLVSQDDLAEARLVAGYVQRQTEAGIRGE